MAGMLLTNPVHLRWRAMRAQRLDPAAAERRSLLMQSAYVLQIQHDSQVKVEACANVRYAAHSRQDSDITPLPGRAIFGLMHRSNLHLYSINSSARRRNASPIFRPER